MISTHSLCAILIPILSGFENTNWAFLLLFPSKSYSLLCSLLLSPVRGYQVLLKKVSANTLFNLLMMASSSCLVLGHRPNRSNLTKIPRSCLATSRRRPGGFIYACITISSDSLTKSLRLFQTSDFVIFLSDQYNILSHPSPHIKTLFDTIISISHSFSAFKFNAF